VRFVMTLIAASTLSFCSRAVQAQGQQLWLDYQVNYPFANAFLFETTGSYQTTSGGNEKWRSFNVTPTLEWQSLQYLDVIVNVPVAYTAQTSSYNSFEVDPALSARYHITQNRRITSNFIFKVEQRFFQNIETSAWETSNRMRLKGEVLVAINGRNLFEDNLWWAILDYEEYFVTDHQLDERFANRRRARIGAGYRLNYRNRFELIYTLQSSRDEINDQFSRLDNVFQLRYKMYLNAAKPKPASVDTQ